MLAGLGCPPAPSTPAPGSVGPAPEYRVGLEVAARHATLGGDAELLVTDAARAEPIGTVPAGATWAVVPDSNGFHFIRPDGGRTASYRDVSAVGISEGRHAAVNGRRYRGRIALARDRSGVTIVNHAAIEDYVAGVVGREMGGRRPDEREALRVQAVVSRSFALAHRGRWAQLGFDAYGDVRDQVYHGVDGETPASRDAARTTAGEVIRYHGRIVDAFFHSTCGFSTVPVEDAFRSASPQPYLRAVSDARGGGGYWCDISPRFRWREEWDAATLRAILSRTLGASAPRGADGLRAITGVAVSRTTRAGRVAEVRIELAGGDARVSGYDVRRVLRPAPDRELLSTAFQLQATTTGGAVTRLVAAGAGAGHGVGLCQWGAIGRARAGQGYRDIVRTYYPGTTVDRVY